MSERSDALTLLLHCYLGGLDRRVMRAGESGGEAVEIILDLRQWNEHF